MRAEVYRLWIPAIAWAAIILISSGNTASAVNTAQWLRQVVPAITPMQLETANFVIRKIGHLVAYAILGALNFRALRGRRPFLALAMAVAVSITDETHQAFVSSRTGTPWDVLIDGIGAALAVLLWRVRTVYSLRI
jgi:VanZ family protein